MSKSMLLVIDYINGLVNKESKIAAPLAERVALHHTIKRVNYTLNWARNKGIPICLVKVGFSPDYHDCPRQSPVFGKFPDTGAMKIGSWDCEFHPDLSLNPKDYVVIKTRVNAFHNTSLDNLLREQGIDTLVICGVSTNMAVELTARDAHDRDYKVIVLTDACESYSEAAHKAALESLPRVAKIMTVTEWAR